MNRALQPDELRFVCPACRAAVEPGVDRYACSGCDRIFPILFGIPDFRLRSDRYLSLAEERDKAGRLHQASKRLNFAQLLAYYYSITDDVSAERAKVFAGYVTDGPKRAAADLGDFGPTGPNDALLDAGCGAGSALIAAQSHFGSMTGVDIALRWLVICKKRLEEEGVVANLVCADIESLPFETNQFSHILATDVIEHVYDRGAAVCALAAQLAPHGLLWMSAVNRLWPGPHPATGKWAAGYRSKRAAAPGGYDPLRNVVQLTARDARDDCVKAGLDVLNIAPRRRPNTEASGRGLFEQFAIGAYSAIHRVPAFAPALTRFGPAFQILATKP